MSGIGTFYDDLLSPFVLLLLLALWRVCELYTFSWKIPASVSEKPYLFVEHRCCCLLSFPGPWSFYCNAVLRFCSRLRVV